MQENRSAIHPLIYFTLVSVLVDLIFISAAGALVVLFSLKLPVSLAWFFIIFMVYKAFLVGFVSWRFYKKAYTKEFLGNVIGIYLGRFFGILIGGLFGYLIGVALKTSSIIWIMIGALAFYFLGRFAGKKVAALVIRLIDKVFFLPEAGRGEQVKPPKKFSWIATTAYILFPWLFVVLGFILKEFMGQLMSYNDMLPVARIAVIVFSVITIGFPWLMKNRLLEDLRAIPGSPEKNVFLLGLVFSIVSIIYGLLLFLAFGASIFELSIFASISSIAALAWSLLNWPVEDQSPHLYPIKSGKTGSFSWQGEESYRPIVGY